MSSSPVPASATPTNDGSRAGYLREQRERHGRRAIAALPVEHPREFATALGRVTVELWGPPGIAVGQSQAWLPSFSCPLARNALEWILRGRVAEVADLLVVPHTCDSLQALAAQVIDLGAGDVPAVTFYHPRNDDPLLRATFVRDELARFRTALERRLGPIADEALSGAVALHRESDRLARRLLDEGPREGLGEAERYGLLRRREWTWVEDQIAALGAALDRPAVPPGSRRGVPILLSGIVPEPPGLLDALADSGLRVAADDLAGLGRRIPERLPPPTGDPIQDLAARYESLAPCSTRTGHLERRIDHVVSRARAAGVRGALFVVISRCEPELFDLPQLREALRGAGIPSAVIETELEASLPGSLRTRIEAFAESVTGGDGPTAFPAAAPLRDPASLRGIPLRVSTPSTFRKAHHLLEARLAGPAVLAVQSFRRLRKLGRKPPPAPFGPPLRASVALRGILEQYYLEGRTADGARPVAWVTSGAPVEILRPLGYYVAYPENHAAICAARKKAQGLCEAAEQEGYSRNLCSYARTDFGMVISGRTPVGRVPRPDLLVTCTNICQTVAGWYRVLSRRLGVPLVVIDTPFLQGGLQPHHVRYVRRQIEDFAAVAERVAGRTLSMNRLDETVGLAQEASMLWGECLEMGRRRPAPWFGIEAFLYMAPMVILRGTDVPIRFYRALLAELRERVGRGVAGVEGERIRLLWDNLPVWSELRRMSELLGRYRANFVAATYTHAWSDCADLLQPGDPFESAARTYASVLLNRDLATRARELADIGRRFGADGAVFHADRSCKPYSLGQHGLRERLAARHGLPGLVVEMDHSDPRDVAGEASANRMEAFLEGLGGVGES
ncbi:MAG: 2-hydroxyacyl-CoA dehydratase [Deltaproteobacteria bacterium]|nr:2-hydroxyacyl-CoA dehydratase [Deltaproteobacteria bacterium]